MKTGVLLLAVLLAAAPTFSHKGDGAFTDHGPRGAHNRFEIDFGPVDLELHPDALQEGRDLQVRDPAD